MRTIEDMFPDIPAENVRKNKFYYIGRLSARCNFDFPYFAETVLGMKISEFHKEPVKYIYSERFILIIWARGHLKTTIWSEAYPIWRLWKERGIEIAVTSSALEQSQRVIENVQTRIEDNEFLKELVPTDKQTTWNKSQLNTENGNKYYQKPFNSTSRGIHVDYLILDDILREENISQEQIKDIFWSVFFPTTNTRKGQTIMVGTPMTMKDLFADIKESGDWKVIHRPCVYLDDQGNWTAPVWKERFTLEELKKIKDKMGSLRFEREYMCNPMGGGASIFKNIRIGDYPETDKPISNEDYYIGVDVAMKGGPRNDFLVYSILGKDNKTGMIKQRKMERYKGWGDEEIIARLKILNRKFHPRTIMMENTGLSVGLVKALQSRDKYPDLYDIVQGFVSNKRVNKEDLIAAINVGFETNVLSVLDNTIQYNELLGFKAKEDTRTGKITYEGVGEHDDTVMALGLAMVAIQLEETGSASIDFI